MDRKKYWVYIVCSRSGTLYIGMSNDLARRMLNTRVESSRDLPVSITAIGWFTTRVLMMCETRLTARSN